MHIQGNNISKDFMCEVVKVIHIGGPLRLRYKLKIIKPKQMPKLRLDTNLAKIKLINSKKKILRSRQGSFPDAAGG